MRGGGGRTFFFRVKSFQFRCNLLYGVVMTTVFSGCFVLRVYLRVRVVPAAFCNKRNMIVNCLLSM